MSMFILTRVKITEFYCQRLVWEQGKTLPDVFKIFLILKGWHARIIGIDNKL